MLQEEQKEEKDWQHNIIAKIKHFIRIKTSKEFDGVYGHSTKVCHTPYFVLFYQRLNSFKVGFVASKKMGNAVHRNRAKRLLRAHFIENIDCLKSGSYVLVAKSALLNESYLVIRKAYLHTLKKCTAL